MLIKLDDVLHPVYESLKSKISPLIFQAFTKKEETATLYRVAVSQ